MRTWSFIDHAIMHAGPVGFGVFMVQAQGHGY